MFGKGAMKGTKFLQNTGKFDTAKEKSKLDITFTKI
jgi:hypothetical protein